MDDQPNTKHKGDWAIRAASGMLAFQIVASPQ
jgi:hypothetical protein